MTFKPGDKFYYEVEQHWVDSTVYFVVSVFQNENDVRVSHSFQTKPGAISTKYRTTSLWFGGADNDGNKLGGVAPSNVQFKLKHTLIKR